MSLTVEIIVLAWDSNLITARRYTQQWGADQGISVFRAKAQRGKIPLIPIPCHEA